MSELKVYHHELRHNEYEEFYLKYEADKVIAELKADYQEACDRLQTENLIKDEQLAETRHHKYKRCLAMASYWVAVYYQCVDDKHRQSVVRHHRKWVELANKFEETK
jgi:hypothetical protein